MALRRIIGWIAVLGIGWCLDRSVASETVAVGMRSIPSGSFSPLFRGANEPREIFVPAFCIDVVPVSNADFLEFVRQNPKWRRSQVKRLFADAEYLRRWESDLELGTNAAVNVPVTYVSWFAAKAYAAWRGKRLPSTAEWEYAAAASPKRVDGENDPLYVRQIQTWYSTPSQDVLLPVGRGQTNVFGIRDLHGLVWEWVSDFNTAMVTGDARGDTGLERQLFCGAGSEGARNTSNYPAFMRYGFRSSLRASYTVPNLGFRCARDVVPRQP